MGEEADRSEYDHLAIGDDDNGDGDDGRVLEWEMGLPSADDLTPLSKLLVPPELASAFRITPEPARTNLDVHRASQSTLSSLRRHNSASSSTALKSFSPFPNEDPMVLEADDPKDGNDSSPKIRRLDAENSADDQSARALKRPRLVWTPQLHKRFVEVVAHLGIKNAVPKTIMQLMNVEGLTRENVASHLQKYRLYLKRMQGLPNEGPSASDSLFVDAGAAELDENSQPPPPPMQQQPVPMPMPYTVPTMIAMPVFGMPHHHHHGQNNHHGYESQHHHFGGFGEQRSKDWPSGNKFGSVVSYPPRVNDK